MVRCMRLAGHRSLARRAAVAVLEEGRTRAEEVGHSPAGPAAVGRMGVAGILQLEAGEEGGHRSNRLVVGKVGRSPAAEEGGSGLVGHRRAAEDIEAAGNPVEVGHMCRRAVL